MAGRSVSAQSVAPTATSEIAKDSTVAKILGGHSGIRSTSIRVLVVDDSAFMRRVIGEAIDAEPDMELAGVAINGLEALLKVEQLQPDVVTLDVEMPEMDGLSALRHLMARYPRPVVMVSSATQAGAVATLRALSIGAVDFVGKPSGSVSLDFRRVRAELLDKIRIAADARVQPVLAAPKPVELTPVLHHLGVGRRFDRLVVIGASTGGPRALAALVPALPADDHTAYLIVQHMPAGFTGSLAERLDNISRLTVREAVQGDRLAAGTALVAPGDFHVHVTAGGGVDLDNTTPRLHGVRPSIDITLDSVSKYFGARAVVVVLTGMGRDGADGALAVHQAGGSVLAEDESTSVVWGMPRAVVENGAAERVVPLNHMASAIELVLAMPPQAPGLGAMGPGLYRRKD
jgi:two-component system, chemotaxis family, protein-glutamate methylesterase/glutaminase